MPTKSSLTELIAQTKGAEETALRREFFNGVEENQLSDKLNEFNETCDILSTLMTSHMHRDQRQGYNLAASDGRELMRTRERGETPLLSFKEALLSNDASIVFKRVISDVLLQPTETPYIGQDILARKIVVDGVRQVTFPTMGAIRAHEITEAGEYRQESPSFTQHSLELRVRKYGLALSIGDDIIEDSMWDIFGLYVSMARDAMKRKKEELIFNETLKRGHVVFDNAAGVSNGYTTGTDVNGNLNGSLTMLDILDAAGALIANGYTPTDIVLHPLAWVMLAKDPRLLFHSLMGSNYFQTMPNAGIDAASIQRYVPFGALNIVTTPQLPFTFHTSITMSGSAMPVANTTDFVILDRNQSIVVLQRDEMHAEEFDDPYRDIHMMRMGERYAVGTLDGGRSIVTLRNLRLVQNHAPVFNVGTMAPV